MTLSIYEALLSAIMAFSILMCSHHVSKAYNHSSRKFAKPVAQWLGVVSACAMASLWLAVTK